MPGRALVNARPPPITRVVALRGFSNRQHDPSATPTLPLSCIRRQRARADSLTALMVSTLRARTRSSARPVAVSNHVARESSRTRDAMRYTGLMARTNRHRLRALADRIMADARQFDRLVRRDPRAVAGAPEEDDHETETTHARRPCRAARRTSEDRSDVGPA